VSAIVPPPEQQLARVESAAMLAHWQCPHCVADLHVDAWRDGLPLAVGVTHQPGCPDESPDFAA
jgi:hypothetical protein